jgi:SAM-dependent methyltransferase
VRIFRRIRNRRAPSTYAIPELHDPEILERAEDLASRFKVSSSIHPEDLLFRFFRDQTPGEEAVVRYFESGHGDATQIGYTLKGMLSDVEKPRVLEFAAGFGRVSRHIPAVIPSVDFTVSDIHAPAIKFAKKELKVAAFKSAPTPARATITKNSYDLIFTLSFFSHLPDSSFGDWLRFLHSGLKVGGYLLFTTHGETSMQIYEHLAALYDSEKGCGYGIQSDQPDIEGDNYGTAVTDFDYVFRHIRMTDAKMIRFNAGGWWGHQDEWIIQRTLAG